MENTYMYNRTCEKYHIKAITSLSNLAGKVVLLRADLNVPMDEEGVIIDDSRMKSVIPTLDYLLQYGAHVVIMSHFGDPKNNMDKQSLSFNNIISQISEIINTDIIFCYSHMHDEISISIDKLRQDSTNTNRRVLLLENLRFSSAEKNNDFEFAKMICDATSAEIYVNDAFSVSHREHASIVAIPKIIGLESSYAGISLLHELTMLEENVSDILKSEVVKSVAIVGGQKISTKLPLLKSLVRMVDRICIVGGMANTFLHALGIDVGESFYEHSVLSEAKAIIELCNVQNMIPTQPMQSTNNQKCNLILPIDVICENSNGECYVKKIVKDLCDVDEQICDIGMCTNALMHELIGKSDFVVWNGPGGICEDIRFCIGTDNIARSIAYHTRHSGLTSVVGGGDTVAVLRKLDLLEYTTDINQNFSYVSNAGGAFLTWLTNGILVGITALQQ